MKRHNIETATGRRKLPPRKSPYYNRLVPGRHIGYWASENPAASTWKAKQDSPRTETTLARTDDVTYEDAVKLAQAWFESAPVETADRDLTVAGAIAEYLAEREKVQPSHDIEPTRYRLNRHVIPVIGHVKAAEVTTRQLRDLRAGMVAVGDDEEAIRKSKDSANRTMSGLRRALGRLFEDGRLDNDTAWRRLKPFKNVAAARSVFFSEAEAGRLLAKCGPDLRALVGAGFLTAARPDELTRAKVGDIDIAARVWDLKIGKQGPRSLPLTTAGVAHFAPLVAGRADSEQLFRQPNGRPWTTTRLSFYFKKAVRAASLDEAAVLYSCRHSAISWQLMAAVPIQIVSDSAGTSPAMIQSHYKKFILGTAREQLELVGFTVAPDSRVEAIR